MQPPGFARPALGRLLTRRLTSVDKPAEARTFGPHEQGHRIPSGSPSGCATLLLQQLRCSPFAARGVPAATSVHSSLTAPERLSKQDAVQFARVLIFWVIVYALYHVLPFRAPNMMLLAASYIFYGWWDWRFLFLMIFTTSFDYWTGLMIERGRLRRAEILVLAVLLSSAAVLMVGCDIWELLRVLIGNGTDAPIVTPKMPFVLVGIPSFFAVATLAYRILIRLPEQQRRHANVTLEHSRPA
jgi:hypothetical protein